jgi:phage tail P2-like protein
MKRLDEITIADLMPDSISGDAQVSATARAIDPQLRLISEAVDRPLILASIDELSAGVLEHLAVQYDVTAWDSAWPTETKRAVLKTAIADKRKMGTRGAVQRAIEAVAPIATITEWWQDTSGDMPPHTFKIDLLQEESAVDAETQADAIAQVNEAKPVRSHYTFTAIQKAGSGFYFAGVLRAIAYARVRSAGITIERTSIQAGICAALRGMNIRRLLASSHMGEMPEPVVPDVPLFGGDFFGNRITMESVDGGGSLIDKYAHYKALFELRGWSPGGDFTEYQAIGGILTGTSDDAMFVQAGSMGGVIDEYIPPLPVQTTVELNLGLRWDVSGGTNTWLAKTFPANDWWWSGIISQEDVDTLDSVGGSICPTSSPSTAWPGLIGALKFEPYHFTYELLKMYSGLGVDEVSFDPSNFSLIGYEIPDNDSLAYRSCMLIRATNAFGTLTKSYRVRITNKYPNDRDSIFVMLGLKYDYSLLEWKSVTFSGSGSYWWAGILNSVDQAKLQALGLVSDTEYPFDEVLYSDAYEYECLGVYYNLWGNPIYSGENFHVEKAQDYQVITLVSNAAVGEYTKYWLCKITPKSV